MRRLLLPTLAVLSAAALAGCGNKGPLVLPTKPAAPASEASAPMAPATVDSTLPAAPPSAPAPAASR